MFVERLGADDVVGDFFATEFGFKESGLFVGAEEDGDVAGGEAFLFDQEGDFHDDPFCFGDFVIEIEDANWEGGVFVGAECFGVSVSVVFDEFVGCFEDG